MKLTLSLCIHTDADSATRVFVTGCCSSYKTYFQFENTVASALYFVNSGVQLRVGIDKGIHPSGHMISHGCQNNVGPDVVKLAQHFI